MSISRPSDTELQLQFNQVLELAAKVIVDQHYFFIHKEDIQKVYTQAISIIKNARQLGISLDLTAKSQQHSSHDINILCISLAANALEYIDELLTNEFNPNKHNYNAKNLFPSIHSYEAVQLLLKHGVLQQIKEKQPKLLDKLMQESAFITLASIRELNPLFPEIECKELPLAKNDRDQTIYKLPEMSQLDSLKYISISESCLGLYNLGTKIINKYRKLLANYNLLPHTYSECRRKGSYYAEYNKPYTDQLKILYVIRIALDTFTPEDVWKLRKLAMEGYQGITNDQIPICFPTGAKFFSFEAISEFFGLYISNNPKQFDPIGNKDPKTYEYIQSNRSIQFRPAWGIGVFTGLIPGYGYINSENILDVYNAVVASAPKFDIFKLLYDDKMKQQAEYKSTHGAHIFVKNLIKPIAGFFASKSAAKSPSLDHEEKKSLAIEHKESKLIDKSPKKNLLIMPSASDSTFDASGAPGGPSFR